MVVAVEAPARIYLLVAVDDTESVHIALQVIVIQRYFVAKVLLSPLDGFLREIA